MDKKLKKTIDFGYEKDANGFRLRTFVGYDYAEFSEVLSPDCVSQPVRTLTFYYPHLKKTIPGLIPNIERGLKERMKRAGCDIRGKRFPRELGQDVYFDRFFGRELYVFFWALERIKGIGLCPDAVTYVSKALRFYQGEEYAMFWLAYTRLVHKEKEYAPLFSKLILGEAFSVD